MRRTVLAPVGLLVSATALLAVVACSSSTDEQPTPNPVPTAQPTADTGVTPPATDGGAEASAKCVGSEGCYACEVTKLDQALNACSDSQCAPFDNTRLPLYVGGVLPPVP